MKFSRTEVCLPEGSWFCSLNQGFQTVAKVMLIAAQGAAVYTAPGRKGWVVAVLMVVSPPGWHGSTDSRLVLCRIKKSQGLKTVVTNLARRCE